jgi:hypothetical protein
LAGGKQARAKRPDAYRVQERHSLADDSAQFSRWYEFSQRLTQLREA